MHIPDNYLSPLTCAVAAAAMVPVWAFAVKKTGSELERSNIPLLGIGAAFSFLLMMFNVPLPGGTTGHAVGGTLVAVLLGPWEACIAITIALLIQALLFGDGGILSFAANCLNMAFALPFAGYFIYKMIKERIPGARGEFWALAAGSYIALNLAAFLTAVEFGIQPLFFVSKTGMPLYAPYPLSISLPAMMLPHLAVAGVVEAAFTVSIYAFIKKVSPLSIHKSAAKRTNAIYALLAALILLSPLGLLASGTAWGEWGADEIGAVVQNGTRLGFVPAGMENGFSFPVLFADYTVSGLPEALAYILSACLGSALLIIAFKLLGHFGKRHA